MEITLNELKESKIFVKEDSSITFKNPKEYLEPFFESTAKFNPEYRVTIQNKVTNREDSGIDNTSYGRFMVEALLGNDYDVQDCQSTIGFIVALDTQKPIMKTFSGKNVFACTNLTIFNAENVFSQELLGNTKSLYAKVTEYSDKMAEELEEFNKLVEALKNKTYSGSQLEKMTGKLLLESLKQPKLGHTVINQGTKELLDAKSRYRLSPDGSTSAWNYYNSITEFIKKADVLDRSTKTVLLSNIFLN